MENLSSEGEIKEAIRNGDFAPLVTLFRTRKNEPFIPSKGQMDIIESIITKTPTWQSINAYTRYGKSEAVAIGCILLAILEAGEKIYIVAPTGLKTKIIMRYIGQHLGDHPFFMSQLSKRIKDKQQLLSGEVSQSLRTFSNNSSIQIQTADILHDGNGVMGEGGTAIIVDECEGIPPNIVLKKILRMRENDEALLLLISNPTQKGYLYSSMTIEGLKEKWRHIHINWRQGIAEGRTTQNYIDDMAKEYGHGDLEMGMKSITFQIMYESVYPTEYEDSLIPYQKIMDAVKFQPRGGVTEVRMGVDPAHLGADEAPIIDVDITSKGEYAAGRLKVWAKTTVPEMIGIVRQRYISNKSGYSWINIDYQGLQGVVDGLRDKYPGMAKIVNGIKHGENPKGWSPHGEKYSDRFVNTKSRNYWHLRELFMSNLIKIPRDEKLIEQLMGWKYEIKPNGKIFVIDPPGGSPDRSDALVYACAPIGGKEEDLEMDAWDESGWVR